MPIVGFGDAGPVTEGSGDVRVVYNIQYLGENGGSRNNFTFVSGGGAVAFRYTIDGIGETPSVTEGAGSLGSVFSLIGNADTGNTTAGTGFVKHNLSIIGSGEIGKFNYVGDPNLEIFGNIPSSGDVRCVFSVNGSGETPSTTEGTGVVQLGTLIAHGEIGTATEGTGTVELIPNLAATATLATLEQINTELHRQLQKTVSVTFDAVSYSQRADQITLFAMKDIKDNWSSYTDLKNTTNIDWGVSDGTILTMTEAEFGTFYDDTMSAWRDRADRVIEKARDWASSGVALSVIQDGSNWA